MSDSQIVPETPPTQWPKDGEESESSAKRAKVTRVDFYTDREIDLAFNGFAEIGRSVDNMYDLLEGLKAASNNMNGAPIELRETVAMAELVLDSLLQTFHRLEKRVFATHGVKSDRDILYGITPDDITNAVARRIVECNRDLKDAVTKKLGDRRIYLIDQPEEQMARWRRAVTQEEKEKAGIHANAPCCVISNSAFESLVTMRQKEFGDAMRDALRKQYMPESADGQQRDA